MMDTSELVRRLRGTGTALAIEAAMLIDDLQALYDMERDKNKLLFDMIADLRDAINFVRDRNRG
jgi:hypothetical protein